MSETWARVGYAAWNTYVRDSPAKIHNITPHLYLDGAWLTACGMLYREGQVSDARHGDTPCKNCEGKLWRAKGHIA
jgi:hypothetical protein